MVSACARSLNNALKYNPFRPGVRLDAPSNLRSVYLTAGPQRKRTRPRATIWDSSRPSSQSSGGSCSGHRVAEVGAAASASMLQGLGSPLWDSLASHRWERYVLHIFNTTLDTITTSKSTLMSKLTGTHSEVSEIDFTTLTTVPGTLKVHGAPIQILDLRE